MQQPNFYAIIPATVRYNKKLTTNAKLLYGEITALCSKEGFCWATNSYFAELYETAHSSIGRWLLSLKNEGFIYIEIDKKAGNKRKIFLAESAPNLYPKMSIPIPKNGYTPIPKNGYTPIPKNVTPYINTSISKEEEKEEKDKTASPRPILGKKEQPEQPKEKEKNVAAKKESFYRDVMHYQKNSLGVYPHILYEKFYDYWSEQDVNGLLRFEERKFFDLGTRIKTFWKKCTADEKADMWNEYNKLIEKQ